MAVRHLRTFLLLLFNQTLATDGLRLVKQRINEDIGELACRMNNLIVYVLVFQGSDGLGGVSSLAQNWSQNCTELHKEVLLGHINLHVPSNINMFLALFGLIVSHSSF